MIKTNTTSHTMQTKTKEMSLMELLKEPGNDTCADCYHPLTTDSSWAVMSHGIFVCDDCKLVHIEDSKNQEVTTTDQDSGPISSGNTCCHYF